MVKKRAITSRGGRAIDSAKKHECSPQDVACSSQQTINYQQLFENASDAVLVTDHEGRYISANKSACDLTGYSRDELLQMRVGDLVAESERGYAQERFELLKETGRTLKYRVLKRKDGSCVTVEAHATAVGDGMFQTALRDVSQRAATEDALRQSVEAYSTLADLCNAAVVSAGTDGRVISWNPAAEALFGYTDAEAVGMPITNLAPLRLREAHESGFRRHVENATEQPFARTIQVDCLRKDGTEVPVEVSVAVGWRAKDQVVTAVIRDMSQQHEIVERLNDALQRLQFHVQRMPLAYLVWDSDFRAVEWNPAAERIFGYTRAEALGRSAYELIVPPDVEERVRRIWKNLLDGDDSSHSINENVRRDGSRVTCEWFNTPLRDSRGRIHGVASMAMDVSEREQMESQLRNAQKLESLGVLASGVAHDFNSSLMVILGNTTLLRSLPELPARAGEYIDLIENAGLRAGEFIRHLLAYARTGRHNPQPTDLNDVLNDAASFVRSALGVDHELVFDLEDKLPLILADRGQLEQIVLNLCLNAKQAQPERGPIEVTTRLGSLSAKRAVQCVPSQVEPGKYVELVVCDKGCGMDAETTQRIFDPFFTTKADGHGLGLAAVLGILRAHGAVAFVESRVGKGTRFHLYFPGIK